MSYPNWWYWNKELVYIGIFLVLMAVLTGFAVKADRQEYTEKFNKCMNDIHNVYVCETWARGRDVEVYYITR